MNPSTARSFAGEEESRLAARLGCAQCRPGGRFASRRIPAALMIGVLALGSISPSAALGAEGDRDVEGGAVPEDVGGGDVDLGATGDLGVDDGAVPAPEDSVAPAGAAPSPAPAAAAPAPDPAPTEVPPSAPVPANPAAALPAGPEAALPAQAPAGLAPSATQRQASPRAARSHRRVKVSHPAVRAKRRVTKTRVAVAPARAVSAAAPAAAAPRSAPAPRRITVAIAPVRSRPARPGSKTHVVATGESLWSIAADHLGGSASSEAIGREVERLWQANRARIGTGSRDLLLAGTRLRLS
jgi:hypothetical protein